MTIAAADNLSFHIVMNTIWCRRSICVILAQATNVTTYLVKVRVQISHILKQKTIKLAIKMSLYACLALKAMHLCIN